MSLRFRIALSAACAALALLAFWSYGSQVRKEADLVRQEAMERYGGEVVSLVVANRTIEAGEQIGMADVSRSDWLVDLAPEGCVTALEDAIGMTVTVPVPKGAPLTELNFREATTGIEVPEGRIALSVPVTDRVGLPREVRAGSVIAAYAVGDLEVRLVSGDLMVLSVPGEASLSRSDASLSVAVWPEVVSDVLLASARGELRLALPGEGVEGLGEAGPPRDVGAEEGEAQADADAPDASGKGRDEQGDPAPAGGEETEEVA